LGTAPPKTFSVDPAKLLSRAVEVAGNARQYGTRAELDRRLPDEAIELLVESGLVRILRPARLGGYEADPVTYVDVGRELGKGMPALAWIFGVLSIHEWYMAYTDVALQEEVWAKDNDALVVDAIAPVGSATWTGDGFRLSGHWKFASGVEWCSWAALGAMTTLPDATTPEPCALFVPRAEFSIVDDWHTIGMRGTASRSVVVDDAFVPQHRILPIARLAAAGRPTGPMQDDGPLYRVPFTPMLATAIFPTILGVAERALEEFSDWASRRVRAYEPGARQREAPSTQFALAEATARWYAAHALAHRYASELTHAGEEGHCEDDPLARARYFAWRVTVARMCTEVVEKLFLEAGGNAIFDTHPLQQLWRDCHAGAQHVSLGYSDGITSFGRTLMGMDGHPLF